MLSVRIRKVLPSFALDVEWEAANEVVALFGASGSGKSLTLHCLAGLIRPDDGRITVGDRTLFESSRRVDVHARDRRVGYLLQGYALFPHLTVDENIAFGLHRLSGTARRNRTAELVEALDLRGTERMRPQSLSGGQQQRVALGRALAADPDLLLLDEPLSALDPPLRSQLRRDLTVIVRRYARTTVVVTHDVGEAFQLADRIVVYDKGRVVQSALKDELFARPASEHVARLLGARNILFGVIESVTIDQICLRWHGHRICAANSPPGSHAVSIGHRVGFFIRAEDITLARGDWSAIAHVEQPSIVNGTIVDRVDMGASYTLRFAVANSGAPNAEAPPQLEVDVPKAGFDHAQMAPGANWQLVIRPAAVRLLP